MTRRADVVVIGGGVIGAGAARELARRGARVTLVERDRVGDEATRAAAGLVAPQAECEGPGPVLALGLVSRTRWPAWAAALRDESGVDLEYRTGGIVYAALDAADVRVLDARARWQRRAGLRVGRLSPAAARRLVPPLGDGARRAYLFPDEHRVNNERLGAALRTALRRAGVRLLEGTAARAVTAARGRVTGVATTRGRIAAPAVVHAAGAWAAEVALPRGVAGPPVHPVRGQMLVLRARPGFLRRPLYSRAAYVVPRADGRLLVGSTYEHVGFEKCVTAGAAARLLAAACRVAPALASRPLEHAYAGLRPGTPDHRPIVGAAPGVAGLFYATGHYRSGILLAPATAEAIADLVLVGSTRLPIAAFAPARFRARLTDRG
jgi:glycine oxidase